MIGFNKYVLCYIFDLFIDIIVCMYYNLKKLKVDFMMQLPFRNVGKSFDFVPFHSAYEIRSRTEQG